MTIPSGLEQEARVQGVTSPGEGWFPVALADDLEPSTSAGTRLHGRELVVWRDEVGAVHVWEDRCPHRGMRLSFGFVRGNHIACLYHGWRFDAAGRCRFIPAHPNLDVPPTIQVNRYGSAAWRGLVWVFDGAPEAASALPPDGETTPVRSISITAPATQVIEMLETAASPFAPGEPPRIAKAGALIVIEAGGDTVLAGVQPLSSSETCLHFVIAGGQTVQGGLGQARVSKWAEALRRDAEDSVSHLLVAGSAP